MKLLCIGEMVIDFLPGQDEGVFLRKAGGGPANVAIAASRQGCNVGFCGMMGNDDFGHFLLNTLKENHVFPLVEQLTDEAVTTMAFVTLNDKGDRSFTFARKPGADMFLQKRHLEHPYFDEASIFYFGSCSLSAGASAETNVYAMEKAHSMGKMVAFDVNYRDLLWDGDRDKAKQKVASVLPLVDILKISEEEVDFVGGEACLQQSMKENDISVILMTLGENGGRCFFQDKILYVPGIKTDCVDATGAGDAFFGSFLSVLLKNSIENINQLERKILLDALQVGNIAGSLCVQKKGALESLPYEEDVYKQKALLYVNNL